MKFEVETMKQMHLADAESELAEQKAALMRAKEMVLFQKDDIARKDAELEAERILRGFQERLAEEKERMQTMHQMQLQQTKFMAENRIKLELSRAEMQNDQLFEAANELSRLQEQLN